MLILLQFIKKKILFPVLKDLRPLLIFQPPLQLVGYWQGITQMKYLLAVFLSFLNPSGQDLILLAEDTKRNYRLDFLEMEYYRFLYKNEKLHNHLTYDNGLKVRYNRNSCRETTSRINQTDIAIHASICAKAIKHIVENRKQYCNASRFTMEHYPNTFTSTWNFMVYYLT